MSEMRYQPRNPWPGLEACEQKLVQGDSNESGQGNLQGVPVEQGYAYQREREQDEIERNVRE